VVREHAVEQRQAPLGRQIVGNAGDELRADRKVAEHPALVAQLEPRSVGELAGLADVVEERAGPAQRPADDRRDD
jgi:hypothetical protein